MVIHEYLIDSYGIWAKVGGLPLQDRNPRTILSTCPGNNDKAKINEKGGNKVNKENRNKTKVSSKRENNKTNREVQYWIERMKKDR